MVNLSVKAKFIGKLCYSYKCYFCWKFDFGTI